MEKYSEIESLEEEAKVEKKAIEESLETLGDDELASTIRNYYNKLRSRLEEAIKLRNQVELWKIKEIGKSSIDYKDSYHLFDAILMKDPEMTLEKVLKDINFTKEEFMEELVNSPKTLLVGIDRSLNIKEEYYVDEFINTLTPDKHVAAKYKAEYSNNGNFLKQILENELGGIYEAAREGAPPPKKYEPVLAFEPKLMTMLNDAFKIGQNGNQRAWLFTFVNRYFMKNLDEAKKEYNDNEVKIQAQKEIVENLKQLTSEWDRKAKLAESNYRFWDGAIRENVNKILTGKIDEQTKLPSLKVPEEQVVEETEEINEDKLQKDEGDERDEDEEPQVETVETEPQEKIIEIPKREIVPKFGKEWYKLPNLYVRTTINPETKTYPTKSHKWKFGKPWTVEMFEKEFGKDASK